MFQPRRLRTRKPSSVETIARKPSHLSSKDQAGGQWPSARQHRFGQPQGSETSVPTTRATPYRPSSIQAHRLERIHAQRGDRFELESARASDAEARPCQMPCSPPIPPAEARQS